MNDAGLNSSRNKLAEQASRVILDGGLLHRNPNNARSSDRSNAPSIHFRKTDSSSRPFSTLANTTAAPVMRKENPAKPLALPSMRTRSPVAVPRRNQ
jgi:hypothetical protein